MIPADDEPDRRPFRATIIVELRDGQTIDLSQLPFTAAMDLLESTERTSSVVTLCNALVARRGGYARAKNLSASRRRDIATLAARTRWAKKP